MRTSTVWMGSLILGVGAIGSASSAAVVTYHATGLVQYRDSGGAQFPAALSGVVAGDVFDLTLTCDPSLALDSNPGNLNSGLYQLPAGTYSASLRLGTTVTQLSATGPVSISMSNNVGLLDVLEFSLGNRTLGNGFYTADDLLLTIVFPNTAYSSDALPTNIAAPISGTSSFAYSSFLNLNPFFPTPASIGGATGSFEVIPTPGSVYMLAMTSLFIRRRRNEG